MGPVGGLGGAPAPVGLKIESIGLNSSLPNFQSPELQPANNSGAAVPTYGPSFSNTSSAGNAVPVNSGDVGEAYVSSQHQNVALIVHPPTQDEDKDDDDDEEGDMPWWLWLLLTAGVAGVVNRLRR